MMAQPLAAMRVEYITKAPTIESGNGYAVSRYWRECSLYQYSQCFYYVQFFLCKVIYPYNSGNEALNVVLEVKPDLILMDINMPGLSGYDVTSRLKKGATLADIPVIFLTGKTPDEDPGKSFKSGGVTLVRKPFNSQQLRDVVKLCLQSVLGLHKRLKFVSLSAEIN